MKTRAVCAMSGETVALCEVSVPDPEPTEVLVATEYSWISTGTERWVITGQFHSPGQPPVSYPLVPGYQKVGTVLAVGVGVTGVHPGQRVFASTSRILTGAASAWGGHIAHSVCDEREIIPLPEGLDPVDASALVLTQVGYNGGARPPVNAGDPALVIGDGLVGQWLAQMLRHRGARVVLVGRHEERLEMAKRHSADVTANERITALEDLKAEHAPGGFPIVADTVGTAESVAHLLRVVRHAGHIVLNGYYREGEHLLNIQSVHGVEATVHAPAGWTRARLLAALDLVRTGALKVRALLTHTFPAEHADRAYDMVLRKTEPFLGICITWQ